VKKVKQGPQTWLYPLPALLIGTVVEGKPNFMTAAWGSIANAEPPMVSVAIRRSRYSHKAIAVDAPISVNIASVSQAVEVDYCGIDSGSKTDKISKCAFTLFQGERKVPMIEQCPLNLECVIRNVVELGTHSLVVAEVVETYVSDNCLTGGTLDVAKVDPLVYLTTPARRYVRAGETVGQAFSAGLALK
jgi:flavin reductase (DIM6/NTAB) family NADH-FMN oxidoreductase RutF